LKRLVIVVIVVAAVAALLITQVPAWAASLLLYPIRHRVESKTPPNCEDVTFSGIDVSLKGWRCHATNTRRATLIYLHGVADDRVSATGVIERFTKRGYDVIAYDSRGHGESTGDTCTYGYFEKSDLHRVIDAIQDSRIILVGSSMGAAVALQEAADDPRVITVVAAESFSDLRTVAHERAPFFLTEGAVRNAFKVAEQRGHFKIDDVDVAAAASRVKAPILLIHGADDRDTFPAHSQRIFAVVEGQKQLLLVPGAHHNESLNAVWTDVERWVDAIISTEK
jgi:uncharacterized protein